MVIAEKSVCAEKSNLKFDGSAIIILSEAIACQKQSLNLILVNAKSFNASRFVFQLGRLLQASVKNEMENFIVQEGRFH